jgi:hypothetical protein
MSAKAVIQSTRYRIFWISAFAGMTVYIAVKNPGLKDQIFNIKLNTVGSACGFTLNL